MSVIRNNGTNIKSVLSDHPRNTAVTAMWLLSRGITRDMLRNYLENEWLTRIGNGAYRILNETVSLDGALSTLQSELKLSVHKGAWTSLNEVHGKTHNLFATRQAMLFASRGEKLPVWFKDAYGTSFTCRCTNFLPSDSGLVEARYDGFTSLVSGPERALLELMYLCPQVYTTRECYQIMELMVTIKPDTLQTLLEASTSIKVNRLFLYMADTAGHGWFKRLDPSRITLGTGVREIVKGGRYEPKYHLVIDEVRAI